MPEEKSTEDLVTTAVGVERRISHIENQLQLISAETQHACTLITEKMDTLSEKVQNLQKTLGHNGHSIPTQLALIQAHLEELQRVRDATKVTWRGVFLQSVPGLLTAAMLGIFWFIYLVSQAAGR